MTDKEVNVIILASGSGNRFESEIPKQFLKIEDRTILEIGLYTFHSHPMINQIIVVTHPEYINQTEEIVKLANLTKVKFIIPGGKVRQESAYFGLKQISNKDSIVLIHDAARPFIDQDTISNVIKAVQLKKAVSVAVKITDTLYQVNEHEKIVHIPNRNFYYRAQTPQAFSTELIFNAHQMAYSQQDLTHTDDCSVFQKYISEDIYIVNGSEKNIKITWPDDVLIGEQIIKNQK